MTWPALWLTMMRPALWLKKMMTQALPANHMALPMKMEQTLTMLTAMMTAERM